MTSTPKPECPPLLTRSARLDKLSAELVEELLLSTRYEGGTPWFTIIRRKLEAALNERENNP
jgi:hypothetical protein